MGVESKSRTRTYYQAVFYLGDTGATVSVCSCGVRAVSSDFTARIKSVGDVVCDNGGPSRCAITLEVNGLYCHVTGPTTTRYRSLHDLMQACPQMRDYCMVYVYLVTREIGSGTMVTNLRMIGKVRSVSNADGFSATLQIEQSEPMDMNLVPRNTLSKEIVPLDGQPYIDKGLLSQPLPVSLGDCLPGSVRTWGTEWFRYRLGAFGLAVPMHSTIRSHRFKSSGEWVDVNLWTELQTNLDVYSTNYQASYIVSGGTPALVFDYWKDATDTARTGNTNDGLWQDYSDPSISLQACSVFVRSRPWVLVPVVPTPVVDADSNGILAVDGDATTYATIAPGKYIEYEMPSAGLPGPLSHNTTDAGTGGVDLEGANVPVGLKLVALLCVPESGATNNTSTVTLSMRFPNGAVFKTTTTVTAAAPTTEHYKIFQVNVPCKIAGADVGTSGAGWLGTSFESGDFSTSTDNTGNDLPIVYVDGSNKPIAKLPFRIRISNDGGGAHPSDVYAIAVGAIAGCRMNATDAVTELLATIGALGRAINDRKTSKVMRAALRKSLQSANQQLAFARASQDMRLTDRSAIDWSGSQATQTEFWTDVPPPKIGGVAVARASFKDTYGDYTGTVDTVLDQPVHFAKLLLEKYGYGLAAVGTFGNYPDALLSLRSWDDVSPNWQMNVCLNQRQTVGDAIRSFASPCLGLRLSKREDNYYAVTHWLPASGMPNTRFWGGADSLCEIDMIHHVFRRDDGLPMVQISEGDILSVCNNYEISYGSAGHHLAKCSPSGSDDGTGAAWGGGFMPFSDWSPDQLAAASAERYVQDTETGVSPVRRISVPFVEHPRVAARIGMYALATTVQPPRSLELTGTEALQGILPGMVFRLSTALLTRYGFSPFLWPAGTTWDQIYWLCEGNEQRVVEIDRSFVVTQQIRASWLPYRIGEEFGEGQTFAPGAVGGIHEAAIDR
jgi:hypothetical protein